MHKLHYKIKFFIKTNFFLNTELPTSRTLNFKQGLIQYPLFKICHVFDLAQPIMQQQYIGSRTAAVGSKSSGRLQSRPNFGGPASSLFNFSTVRSIEERNDGRGQPDHCRGQASPLTYIRFDATQVKNYFLSSNGRIHRIADHVSIPPPGRQAKPSK